jgi:hypothetical protein
MVYCLLGLRSRYALRETVVVESTSASQQLSLSLSRESETLSPKNNNKKSTMTSLESSLEALQSDKVVLFTYDEIDTLSIF